jgi:hypothetical protein
MPEFCANPIAEKQINNKSTIFLILFSLF